MIEGRSPNKLLGLFDGHCTSVSWCDLLSDATERGMKVLQMSEK